MIDYKCERCACIDDVEEGLHIDPTIYFECDCGELMLPVNDQDKKTIDSAG